MSDLAAQIELTGALEDYLETIYELVRDQKVARVKDIARARKVRAASVTPAMRRLADLGLINYVQREYIDLTPAGEQVARKIFARHQLLTRFFEDFLNMPAPAARADACAMEHNLSAQGMDHLVRFFEFLGNCPEGDSFLGKFHHCSLVHDSVEVCEHVCPSREQNRNQRDQNLCRLAELSAGKRGRVTQILDSDDLRQALLDKGLLPDTEVELLRTGEPLTVKLQGFELQLSAAEGEAVLVEPL